MSNRCDNDVYENGTHVFLTHTLAAKDIETWVQKIASDSKQKVDWYYFGGRAVVLALGNIKKVQDAILANKEMHDKFYKKTILKLGSKFCEDELDQRIIDGIWHYNGF